MVVHGKVEQNKIKFEPSHVFCRYEYSTSLQSSNYGLQSSTNTQQSIKKNINDLDHLLNNLSSHNSSRDVSVMQFDGLNQGCIL